MNLNQYTKAIVAALITGAAALQPAIADGQITTIEWVQIASAVLVSLGVVWGVPNAPSTPPEDPAGDDKDHVA